MVKVYRILGLGLRAPRAESAILALRGGTLVVAEAKRRARLISALEAVRFEQRERLRRAGAALAARRPNLAGAAVRLDLVALAPGRLPVHIPDAWKGA